MLIMICPLCLTRRVHKVGTRPDSIATPGGQEVWICEVCSETHPLVQFAYHGPALGLSCCSGESDLSGMAGSAGPDWRGLSAG